MQLTFTPKAAQKVLSIIADKGGGLALRIRVGRSIGGPEWKMTLEVASSEAMLVNGVPVLADKGAQSHLDGMVVDWVMTPQGPGFGVYDRNLVKREYNQAAD